MKNVFLEVGIYQRFDMCNYACMEEKMYNGSRMVFLMDSSGQYQVIHEQQMYREFSFLGLVSSNDAKTFLSLLKELDVISTSQHIKDVKTYTWGFALLNPVKNLKFKLELWKR